MNNDTMQKMLEIIAEELGNPDWRSLPVPILRTIDRIAALPELQPPGREERVEQVRVILQDSWGGGINKDLAERIVATEPRAMSRKEMVEVAAESFDKPGFRSVAECIRQNNRSTQQSFGALGVVDALVGKIPASGESSIGERSWKAYLAGDSQPLQEVIDDLKEAVVWKEKYERQAAHARRLEGVVRKRNEKIARLTAEIGGVKDGVRVATAERSDRLDKVIAVVNKWLDEGEQAIE